MIEPAVRAAFAQQAGWCRELGSPLTGLILDLVGSRVDRATAVGQRLLDWPGQPGTQFGALPLRLAGGLHALVRRGELPGLAALYPPHPLPGAEPLWREIAAALEHPDLDAWLDGPPQTNEVARSAVLMAGLMTVVAETGLPVSLFEVGASAGLNLLLDRYSYRLGPVIAGADGSPVVLAPEWRGPPPRTTPVRVAARLGVDLNPLDVTQAADRERLVAYLWADQAARIARVEAAIGVALTAPPPLQRGDAADFVEQEMRPEPGVVRVLMHSIAAQYFPDSVQRRIAAHMARAGAMATAEAPVAWVRFEVDPALGARPSLRVTVWPGGQERLLAHGSAHGIWVEWLA